jgi:hypothetical protein
LSCLVPEKLQAGQQAKQYGRDLLLLTGFLAQPCLRAGKKRGTQQSLCVLQDDDSMPAALQLLRLQSIAVFLYTALPPFHSRAAMWAVVSAFGHACPMLTYAQAKPAE